MRGYRIELGEIECPARPPPGGRAGRGVAREDGRASSASSPTSRCTRARGERELRSHEEDAARLHGPASSYGSIAAAPAERQDRPQGAAGAAGARRRRTRSSRRARSEEVLAALWAECSLGRVGVHDDFFALGGHSLLATQVIAAAPLPRGRDQLPEDVRGAHDRQARELARGRARQRRANAKRKSRAAHPRGWPHCRSPSGACGCSKR